MLQNLQERLERKKVHSCFLSLLILCSKQRYQKTVLKIKSDMLAPGCFPTLFSFSLPKDLTSPTIRLLHGPLMTITVMSQYSKPLGTKFL